jgi:hypothetical protein
MVWTDILALYFLISIVLFVVTLSLCLSCDVGLSFLSTYIYQYELYNRLKYEMNVVGIVILETFVTIITFANSVMMLAMWIIYRILLLIWKLYCWIFKKR